MKCEDLSSFTCDELNHFTCDDLILGKLQLLQKIDQDEKVPQEIVDKVYLLCDDIMKQYPSVNISLPTDKIPKLKIVTELLKSILVSIAAEIIYTQFAPKIIELLNQLLVHFNLL